MSGKGCGLWFWYSLDLSLTFFVYMLHMRTVVRRRNTLTLSCVHILTVVRIRNNLLRMRTDVRSMRTAVRICNTFITYSYVLHMHTHILKKGELTCTISVKLQRNEHPSGHMTLIQRRLNVDATSWRCIDFRLRCINVMCPLGWMARLRWLIPARFWVPSKLSWLA